jgi:hypothetical protein
MKAIIVDLDGTLYNSTARNHLAQAGQWDDFHRASSTDKPNHDILQLVNLLSLHEKTIILAVTGRDDRYRDITNSWINRNSAMIDFVLMRPEGDLRSDTVVKIELVKQWLEDHGAGMDVKKEDIAFALEDRDKMVDAWRSWGIPCWQVRAGSY